jgi:hypothetical protein
MFDIQSTLKRVEQLEVENFQLRVTLHETGRMLAESGRKMQEAATMMIEHNNRIRQIITRVFDENDALKKRIAELEAGGKQTP